MVKFSWWNGVQCLKSVENLALELPQENWDRHFKVQVFTNWGYHFLTHSNADSLPHNPFFKFSVLCFNTEVPEKFFFFFFKGIQFSHRITVYSWCFALPQARNDAEVGAGRTSRRHRQKEPSFPLIHIRPHWSLWFSPFLSPLFKKINEP